MLRALSRSLPTAHAGPLAQAPRLAAATATATPAVVNTVVHTVSPVRGVFDDVNLIVKDDVLVAIDGYFDTGFQINGVQVEGSVMVFPTMALLWDATCMEDVHKDSLTLINHVLPEVEIVIVGTGDRFEPLPAEVTAMWDAMNVDYEVMDTMAACGTFNMLSQEGRNIAAAILTEVPYSARSRQAIGAKLSTALPSAYD